MFKDAKNTKVRVHLGWKDLWMPFVVSLILYGCIIGLFFGTGIHVKESLQPMISVVIYIPCMLGSMWFIYAVIGLKTKTI